MPLGREFMLHPEHARQRLGWQGVDILDEVFDVGGGVVFAEAAVFSSRESKMKDHVSNRRVIKLPEVFVGCQLKRPTANYSGALERQVALVPEIELKQSRVILSCAGGDGGGWNIVSEKTIIIDPHALIIFMLVITRAVHRRINADAIAQQAQRAVDDRIRPDHRRNRKADRFDPSEIVALVIEIENFFG